MRYLIIGSGALGTVFGGLLRRAGHHVDFLGRGAHFDALRQQGLKIDGIWGEVQLGPVSVPPAGVRSWYDVVCLCVKSFDTQTACREIADLVRPQGLIISIQNGLGNLETIAQECPAATAVGARVIFGARISQPGVATVTVYADKVLLGRPGAAATPPSLLQVAAHFNQAGIPTAVVPDIIPPLWAKVLYNGALNALGAILGVTYGELAADPHTRQLMEALLAEMYAVASAKGVHLPQARAQDYCRHFFTELVPPTAAHYPSMLQDLQHGRRTEIEALNGAICRYARELGLNTPYNEAICQLVRFLERQGRRTRDDG
ncbi:MAG: ketopantoate reductase family protein [Desulfobacca sp.]|uniref:ketopantoate reductase family protein n=1 Tax=Desulfobacca sp. TaxID=2067990 RepID=UPI0040499130